MKFYQPLELFFEFMKIIYVHTRCFFGKRQGIHLKKNVTIPFRKIRTLALYILCPQLLKNVRNPPGTLNLK